MPRERGMFDVPIIDPDARDEPRSPRVNWTFVMAVTALVVGWLLSFSRNDRDIVERVGKVETKIEAIGDTQNKLDRSFERMEDKLDKLSDRLILNQPFGPPVGKR